MGGVRIMVGRKNVFFSESLVEMHREGFYPIFCLERMRANASARVRVAAPIKGKNISQNVIYGYSVMGNHLFIRASSEQELHFEVGRTWERCLKTYCRKAASDVNSKKLT